jgi:hypothetical protein
MTYLTRAAMRISIIVILGFSLIPILGLSRASAQVVGADDVENIERQRRAQTGMKFLSISVDPRAAAVGSAVTAQEQASSIAMFYNPASMGRMEQDVHVSIGQVQWIADASYNYGAIAIRPGGGNYGTIGMSVVAASYGEFEETIRFDNSQGYIDIGTFSPSAMAVGLGYANVLTDRFSVGANTRYVRQSLAESIMSYNGGSAERRDFTESTMAFDFGVLYRTGFRSLNFAVSVRNFSQEITYAEENLELPLTFSIGMAMDVTDLTPSMSGPHKMLLSVDAERPRDYSEQLKVGLEYMFMNTLALRGGYAFPTDEEGIHLGAGLQTEVGGLTFGADYAYGSFGLFGNVHRLGMQMGL